MAIAAVPIAIVNELFSVAALELGSRAAHSSGLSLEQRGALALALLNVRQQGIAIAGIFWGLWLFPFGVLALRSDFIPRILGALLIAGCFSYLLDSAVALLAPRHREALSSLLMLPLAAGELSMVLWLLIKGVRVVPAGGHSPPHGQARRSAA